MLQSHPRFFFRSILTFNITKLLKKLFQIPSLPGREGSPCDYLLKKADIIFFPCMFKKPHLT
ncbi:hypothetical protein TREVI0001_1710 [Treponema vincentii ATCC 35580]|uniref:Uncharacterized protein n=1 Tax=Treponema vincentii ATCC 35580 TaxID=596324 RepID=C8PNZ1_9SPIR|nr:hypothetical protein TREVI0001_1710 [Treponema vincentii ATCC 35580]